MASLYKKPITSTDPQTGEKKKAKSRKWWGRYQTANGTERRVPLASDKTAAQAMLNGLVRQTEREIAGLVDPTEKHRKRPLSEHIADWHTSLKHKGTTAKHAAETVFKVTRIAESCGWRTLADMSSRDVQKCLAGLREGGLAIQTSNHYVRSIKSFANWLVQQGRLHMNPLAQVGILNPKVDQRHARRALQAEEFSRLIEAAKTGPTIESFSGEDRSMMYLVAGLTGFRKGEIGSLTRLSFQLESDPPTATVAAAYSKRRSEDRQVLHRSLVAQLKPWLAKKRPRANELLFPVSGEVPGGTARKTHMMMRKDIERARATWISEADNDSAERQRREESDFLRYRDSQGQYADFHSLRHHFITSLSRAGVSPKMAQQLARHSDIRLTLGTYSHVDLDEQVTAIDTLSVPYTSELPSPSGGTETSHRADLDSAHQPAAGSPAPMQKVPTMVPKGAENGAKRLASPPLHPAPICPETGASTSVNSEQASAVSPNSSATSGIAGDQLAAECRKEKEVHPRGFEPLTFGSVDRCSIQLS